MPSDIAVGPPDGTQDAATDSAGPAPSHEERRGATLPSREEVRRRLPTALFLGYVVVAFPVLLFGYGRYHWFLRDDWLFLNERSALTLDNVFAPYGAHPVVAPVLVYDAMVRVFGIGSYRPYQALVIGLHLLAVVLVHRLMRQAGVRPWLAAAFASILVLYGPGSENIVWAFQIGFTGALAAGLLHLVLANHDGPLGRRDAAGIAVGVVAVVSTGVGLLMAVVIGGAVLLRRGWKAAAVHTLPLAVAYVAWFTTQHPESTSPFGRPSPDVIVRWVWSAVLGTFTGIGHFTALAIAFGALLVVGFGWAWFDALSALRSGDAAGWRRSRARLAAPTAMLAGSLAWAVLTCWGRWYGGPDAARSLRYVHIHTALALPALAVGAEQVARRWRQAVPILVVLALLPIPGNAAELRPAAFGSNYMEQRERILTTAVRMPFAREVPRDVQPIADAYDGDLTIGFLLDAYDDGRLDASTYPVPPALENELRIRLGLAQGPEEGPVDGCDLQTTARNVALDRGDVIHILSPVNVTYLDGRRAASPPVTFEPPHGTRLVAELDGLTVQIGPVGRNPLGYCLPS